MGMLVGSRRALLGGKKLRVWRPDPLGGTFTAGMAKRATGVFAAAPIAQGDWDGSGTPDVVTFPRGDLLGNQTQFFYANYDPYQGTVSFWVTPEWDGGDGLYHYFFHPTEANRLSIYKSSSNNLHILDIAGGSAVQIDISAWTAGTTYFIVARWDLKNSLDGTNYFCVSINNVHTFGEANANPLTTDIVATNLHVGSEYDDTSAGDSLIQGLRINRFVWYETTSSPPTGVDIGVGDMVANAYAAGAGADPALWLGSWDATFCLPTDATPGALVSGTGEAWSHPHSSNIPDVWGAWDGGLPGTPYAVEFNGTTTGINCGSDVDIDDIQDNVFTVEAWIRTSSAGESNLGMVLNKGNLGWFLQAYFNAQGLRGYIDCATTPAISVSGADDFVPDGKWHHVAMLFDDAGDRRIYLAVDGKWVTSYITQTAGVGAIVSDAGNDFIIGNNEAGSFTFDGAIAWVAISNNARYTPGTDFAPPRAFPADDANYLASWEMDEGTGGAIANTGNQGGAGSGAANRDGTLANGSWSSIWDQAGTPVIPQSVEFNGTTTSLDATSGANIDDLPGGANGFTAQGWFRADDAGESNNGTFWNKTQWYMRFDSATTIRVFIDYDNTDIDETFSWTPDGIFHHWALTYNENGADRFVRVYCDGVLVHTTAASVGNYVADAANTLYIGNNAGGTATLDGGVGWQALSDIVIYSATFVAESRVTPPADDGNMHLRYIMTDGAGTTVDDTSGNAYDGTLTNYVWNNTPDMAVDEPGARVYNGGINVGTAGVGDGVVTTEVVTAETDYVLRVVGSYGQSGRGWPQIVIWDNTGGPQIGADFFLPRMSNVHTGGNNSATLINANGAFTQQLVGWTTYNVTDGCSGVITAVSGDKTTCTYGGGLSGGTDDDFDTNDVYIHRPPNSRPYCRHPFAVEATFVFRTPVGCVEIDIELDNANTALEGVLQWHQCEVLESLEANGDHEAAAGNPAILTGWTNNGLDAGDVETDVVTIHAGAQSLEWNPGAILGEGQYETITTTIGKFLSFGGWVYGDGSDGFRVGAVAAVRALLQYSLSAYNLTTGTGAFWTHFSSVLRALHASPRLQIEADAIGGDGFTDDFYAVELDDVTLTVTPASEANSAEGSGIRIDGLDSLTSVVPAGFLKANEGDIRFKWTPRHGDTEAPLFGNTTPMVAYLDGGANDYISIDWSAADTLRLTFNADGAGAQNNTWPTGGAAFTPGTEYEFRIRYWANRAILYVDGVARITINQSTGFVWPNPTTLYYGSDDSSIDQVDAVYAKA